MSASPRARQDVKLARAGVTALFFTNGAMFANFAPRFPELKDTFELSASGYGLLLAAFPLGAILGGPAAVWVINRFTSARTAAFGTVVIASLLFGAAVLVKLAQTGTLLPASTLLALFALMFGLSGASDAVVDVGQNAHGLRVQRLYGRSIINAFHASWSIGAMTGGLMAMIATGLDVPIEYHLGFSGALFAIVGLIAYRFTLPGPDRGQDEGGAQSHQVRVKNWPVPTTLLLLLLLAISGILVEDVAQSWSTLYMRDFLNVARTWAPSAYVSMLAFHFLGRATSDQLVDRLGSKHTIQIGGVLIVVGMSVAALWPNPLTTVLGFALAGLGSAPTVPLAMNAADDIAGLKPGLGLTLVSWLMRLSFLLIPPLMGRIVVETSLKAPIVVLPLAGLVILASTVVLHPKTLEE